MKITPLEAALGALIAVIWLWAVIHVQWLGNLRGPLSPTEHSEYTRVLSEVPPDMLAADSENSDSD